MRPKLRQSAQNQKHDKLTEVIRFVKIYAAKYCLMYSNKLTLQVIHQMINTIHSCCCSYIVKYNCLHYHLIRWSVSILRLSPDLVICPDCLLLCRIIYMYGMTHYETRYYDKPSDVFSTLKENRATKQHHNPRIM